MKMDSENKNKYDYNRDCWDVLDGYFGQNNNKYLINHQHLSFSQFINKYINDIFNQFNPIKIYNNYVPVLNKHQINLTVEFMNYSIGNPIITVPDGETVNMTPQDARNRNLTYASQLTVDIRFKRTLYNIDESKEKLNLDIKSVKEITIKGVNLGKIPIMVQSDNCYLEKNKGIMNKQLGECVYDMGGYFIINGKEKVIIGQERIAENKIFAFRKVLSNKNVEYCVEVHGILDDRYSVVMKNSITLNNKNNIFTYDCSLFKDPINIFLLLKVLGIKTDKDLMEILCFDVNEDVLGNSIVIICKETMINYKKILEYEKIKTEEELINYVLKLVKYKNINKEYVMNKDDKYLYLSKGLEKELLPHLRNNYINKAHYIGVMIRKLIKVKLGLLDFDKRDSFQNKRVETPGYLMASLFRQCINRTIKDMVKNLNKELNNTYNINNGDILFSEEYQNKVKKINDDKKISTSEKKEKILNINYIKLNTKESIKAISEKKDILESLNSNNIYKIIKTTSIEGGLKYALATGNWSIKTTGDNKTKVGVAQELSRLSYPSYLSHLRRIICPSDKNKKNGKILGPRKQNASQYGFICPAETPEGMPVGLVKNMALSTTITMQLNSNLLIEWIKKLVHDMPESNFKILDNKTIIFVNGNIIGYTNEPNYIYTQFYKRRRTGKIHQHITINWCNEHNEMYFFCDAGRLIRPVFVVKNNNLTITKKHIEYLKKNNHNWNYISIPGLMSNYKLPNESIIDFIDTEESTNCLIAINEGVMQKNKRNFINDYTHCEIHPGLMLGALACVIPFSDYNQSPRNAYQSSMGKQAMGIYATNFHNKMDTHSYIMNNLETPIVKSNFGKYVNYDQLPCGINALVAIGCYTGYNQEDSIILNSDSVDNGLFITTHTHVYKDEEKKIQSNGKEEKFCKPDIKYIADKRNNNYEKLDSRGLVKINSHVCDRDIIIGKKLPIKNKYINGHQLYKDCSTSLKPNESGYIDNVYVNRNEEGFLNCKIKIRDERIPIIGSKFASRVGQKGTVGMTLPKHQMPFTSKGIVPDIIMTPHAIPSRMTVGQLMETLLGKVSTDLGGHTYCTPFNNTEPKKIIEILENNGFGYCGDEVLYSGVTGKQMNVKLYFGPTYYQRLKHMVEDKMHCLTMDHEILTNTGWKYYNDIDITVDKICTLNLYDKSIHYHKPLNKHYYPNYKCRLYHIKNNYIDTIITDNHKLPILYVSDDDHTYYVYKFMTASNLYETLRRCAYFNYNTHTYCILTKPDNNDDITHEIKFENITKLTPSIETTFCFTMPNETFYVRRNGKEYWTGNSRNNGPVVLLTRQPAEGRSREGGLRIGQMETDAIQGHGAMTFLKERLMDVSDKFDAYVCSNCGNYAIVNDSEELYICDKCEQYNDFQHIKIPYATKLFSQELQGIGINMKYKFNN